MTGDPVTPHPALTFAQRDAIAAVHIALAAEREPAGPVDMWRDHFRSVLWQVARAFPEDAP